MDELIVYVLLDSNKSICAIYREKCKADKAMNRFNEDPFLSPDEPDPNAPYSVEAWWTR
jgi:hypothetical protein